MGAARVAVVRTGTANLASVLAGLRRVGAEPFVTERRTDVTEAERLVLPGVGSFGAAMDQLRAHELVEPLAQRVAGGRPTLAVCLGLQLLARESEESAGVTGLGVLPARITRFGRGMRVPQLGWNKVQADAACSLLQTGYAYFANSYRLESCPGGWNAAYAEHGGRFVAGLERGSVLACQFHPELSGEWGLALLRRWLAASREEVAAC